MLVHDFNHVEKFYCLIILKYLKKIDPSNGHYFMILQYADKDLRDYLRKNFKNLQFFDKFRMAEEIAQRFWFLHTKNIVHGDLNSKNILVYNKQIKIIDFGMLKQINEVSTPLCSEIKGMPAYMDPRCFKDMKYDKKSDIFSLGVILLGIQPPFKLLTLPEIFWNMQVLNEFEKFQQKTHHYNILNYTKNVGTKILVFVQKCF
ncbi:kinase-like protein [Gigaspora margarita]|uniref:Kinase-like protein n=1 Tax=Gigaspora margarita TaxID=4874 RepID=A0A8H4EHZ2_GIGMA|nr:kinase-like protein [Gigaspora margarita]